MFKHCDDTTRRVLEVASDLQDWLHSHFPEEVDEVPEVYVTLTPYTASMEVAGCGLHIVIWSSDTDFPEDLNVAHAAHLIEGEVVRLRPLLEGLS